MTCLICGHRWGAYEDYCHCAFGKCHNQSVCPTAAEAASQAQPEGVWYDAPQTTTKVVWESTHKGGL